MNRYQSLLNIKCKKYLIMPILLIFIFVLLYFLYRIDSFDKYTFYAQVEDGYLKIEVPLNNSDNINSGIYLKINNQKFTYKVIRIDDAYVQNDIIYQTYYIKIDKSYLENEIIKITIYTNKEKLIKKIIKVIY